MTEIRNASPSSVTKPVVRFAIPDLELVTVREDSGDVEDADDVEEATENLSNNDRRKRKARKVVPPYKPGTKLRKARQDQRKRANYRGEDSLRNDVVSKETDCSFLL
jgi:hypothetical protein